MQQIKKLIKKITLPQGINQNTRNALNKIIDLGVYKENALDNLTSNIIITSLEFNVTYMNHAAETAWEVKTSEVMGKNLFEFNFPGMDFNASLEEVVQKKIKVDIKASPYVTPKGEEGYFDITFIPFTNDKEEVMGLILVCDNVTQRVIKERELLAYQKKLKRELEEKTENLNKAQAEFDKLKKRLDESDTKIDHLRTEIEKKYKFSNMIAKSKKMRDIFELIPQIAQSNSTVLLTGETGTGKELVAKSVHYNSHRAEGPFVGINCVALTETLLESELFGHEKGAFTGAIREKKGKFELAHRGTLFLDEIGEMPPATQSKILRVLQEKTFERVGGEKTLSVDLRVVAATNRKLEELIEKGQFRPDLYYRLKVIHIELPPLRERLIDLPLLAGFFLKKYREQMKKDVVSISQQALNRMLSYSWPGNVRELENVIEKGVVMAQGEIIEDVDLPMAEAPAISNSLLPHHRSLPIQTYLEYCEKDYLSVLFQKYKGRIKKISEISGLERRTVYNKMIKYGLRKEDFKT
jgi:transcriptional regulator with PAS, ATPase and Fis domain